MARQLLEKKDFTFVGGLNTEAGYLTFPANTWSAGDNIIPDADGSLSRRVKLDFEDSYTLSTTFTTSNKETSAFTSHKWEAVGGNGALNFIVVQQGSIIHFYDALSTAISPNKKSFTIDLSTYYVATSANVLGTSPISCVYGNGNLVVVSADTDPILVKYVAASDTLSVTRLTLKIRDFYGVDDSLDVDEHQATLTTLHHYNLLNQGWDYTKIIAYEASQGNIPSNAQIWVSGKDSSDNFDPALLVKQDFGTSPAPKGRYVLEVFNRDRDTVSGLTGITTETENQRPSAVGFFAGRVWYAGTSSATIGSWVLFSRITDTDAKYEQCYQEADPTSEYISDLIPSDGGVIPIPEAGNIIKLLGIQESLIVFAENGVWQILGDVTTGFRADGYQVKKITSFGCSGAASIVEFENTVAFWSTSGIFILNKDPNTGDFVPQSLSLNKIQTMFTGITPLSKRRAQGFYNIETKMIIWTYLDSPNSDNVTDRFKKDKFLIFDIKLQAFYTYTIASLASNSPIFIGGILSYIPGTTSTDLYVIETDEDTIITSAGDSVIISSSRINNYARAAKYLTVTPSGTDWALTFSDFENVLDAPYKFKDWYTKDSVGAETATMPYLITGYALQESGSHILQAPYIHTFMKRTETGVDSSGNGINDSSALLQGRWEWTDNTISGRWTTEEQVYRKPNLWTPSALPSATYVDGYPVVVAKSKIRGKGHSLHLKYTCESGKDMQLLGWSIVYNKNTNV